MEGPFKRPAAPMADTPATPQLSTTRFAPNNYGPVSALLPETNANFRDLANNNYTNSQLGKHNVDGTGGLLYNPTYRFQSFNFSDSLFRPTRLGNLLPERALRGRYQYLGAKPYKQIEVVDEQDAKVEVFSNFLSSSAYAYNSEIKFNKYVSYHGLPADDTNASSLEGLAPVAPTFTDVTYSSSATITAFSAYDKILGISDANTSMTANEGTNYDPSNDPNSAANSSTNSTGSSFSSNNTGYTGLGNNSYWNR